MMLPTILALLGLAVILLIALHLRRPSSTTDSVMLQGQLTSLQSRLDTLLGAQQATLDKRLGDTGLAVADVREQLGRLAELTTRLETVGRGVTEVQQLLQVPRLRGTLGEVWLEQLLQQVFPDRSYEMQYTFRSGERVDAVVRVGDRLVPIDSKFPLEACQRMLAADGALAIRERREFRRSLRARVDEIAGKYIRPDEGTLEFALMYIPAESVYYEAIVRGEDMDDGRSFLGYAMERRVIPVSPHTFYAYLCAVLHGLRGLHVEQRAREIRAEIGGLGVQFDRFWEAYEKVGTHLGNAYKQFALSDRGAERVRDQFARIAGDREVSADEARLPVPEHSMQLPLES